MQRHVIDIIAMGNNKTTFSYIENPLIEASMLQGFNHLVVCDEAFDQSHYELR
jgi:hypothetical protein